MNDEFLLHEGSILNGKYLVGRVLDRDEISVIYLGLDLSLDQKVEIKEYFPRRFSFRLPNVKQIDFPRTYSAEEIFMKGREIFLEKAIKIAMLNSPSIIHIREYFLENNTAYIVTDCVDGIDLKKEISQSGGRMPWRRVLALFMQLIPEMGRLHKLNVIYRVITPENIKIVNNETGKECLLLNVVIEDDCFISKFGEDYDPNDSAILFPNRYAPFETFSTKRPNGPYTDVYSLCAVMFKAITGAVPPAAPDVLSGEAQIPSFSSFGLNVPESIEKVIRHGLSVKPDDRPQTMRELFDEFSEALSRTAKNDTVSSGTGKTDDLQKNLTENTPAEGRYLTGKNAMNADTVAGYRKAMRFFQLVPGYKDDDQLAEECRSKIHEMEPQQNANESDVSFRGSTDSSVHQNSATDENWGIGAKIWFILVIIFAWLPFINEITKKRINQQAALIYVITAALTSALYLWLLIKKSKTALIIVLVIVAVNFLVNLSYGGIQSAVMGLIGPAITFGIARKKVC